MLCIWSAVCQALPRRAVTISAASAPSCTGEGGLVPAARVLTLHCPSLPSNECCPPAVPPQSSAPQPFSAPPGVLPPSKPRGCRGGPLSPVQAGGLQGSSPPSALVQAGAARGDRGAVLSPLFTGEGGVKGELPRAAGLFCSPIPFLPPTPPALPAVRMALAAERRGSSACNRSDWLFCARRWASGAANQKAQIHSRPGASWAIGRWPQSCPVPSLQAHDPVNARHTFFRSRFHTRTPLHCVS